MKLTPRKVQSWNFRPQDTEPEFAQSRMSTSREDFRDHIAMNVGQAIVATLDAAGELCVLEPHLVQDGRVQVVNWDLPIDDLVPELVRRTVSRSLLHAAASSFFSAAARGKARAARASGQRRVRPRETRIIMAGSSV